VNARYEPGELVDLAIRGARVVETTSGHLQLEVGGGDLFIATVMLPSVYIVRVAPKEWPPRPADVWVSEDGRLWFARASEDYRDDEARMVSADPDSPSESAGTVLNHFGQMRLVYRQGWSPETSPAGRDTETAPEASAVATTGQPADMRAETVAGLRAAADLIESTPDLPMPRYAVDFGWALGSADEARTAAAVLDVPLVEEPVGANAHYRVKRSFGPIEMKLSHVEFGVGPDVTPAVGEVAGPDSPQEGPATTADEPTPADHYHSGGAAGGPGENSANCACGYTFYGFDSQAEALEALNGHIANPPGQPVQRWWFTFGAGQEHDGRYVVIRGTAESARKEMVARFGQRWSDQYPSASRAGVDEFNLTALPRDQWPPRADDGPLPRLVEPAPITDPALEG
jgi:hypothetical protein